MKAIIIAILATAFLAPFCAVAASERDLDMTNAIAESYTYEAAGDLASSIQSLLNLSVKGSNTYFVQLRLGWLYYSSQEWKRSELCYDRACQLAPDAIEPLLGIMLPLQAKGDFDRAIKAGLAVIKKDPCNYTALSRMAWMHYSWKEYQQAAGLYRKLAELYPTDTEMLLGLGYSCLLQGDKRNAASCFRQVLLLAPNSERALAGITSTEATAEKSTSTHNDSILPTPPKGHAGGGPGGGGGGRVR